MNLLFLNSLYSPHIGGGAEIVLQRTVEGLHQRGEDVTVLTTGPQPGLHFNLVRGIKVYRAGLLNTYWHFSEQRPGALARLGWHLRDRYNSGMRQYVREVLTNQKIDLVVCHNLSGWSAAVWDEINEAGIPIVQVLHDMYLLCPGSNMFKKGAACSTPCTLCKHFRQGHAERSAQVDAVVGVSRFLLDKMTSAKFFRNASAHVIYNSSPDVEESNVRFFKDAWARPEPLRFGYIGTLSDQKGLRWLIEQFQRLPFDATLHIAGRGQAADEAMFKALATSTNVHFVGYQKPDEFYRQIDVAVVPSLWHEPFGLVAVEACAHAVPVIASRMGGLPEIIQDPLNGLLCDPADPDSLGHAMLRLHQQPDLLARLSKQARVSVAALLDLDLMLDSYESIFAQTLLDNLVHPDAKTLPYPV